MGESPDSLVDSVSGCVDLRLAFTGVRSLWLFTIEGVVGRDAAVLADSLRTDAHRHRPLQISDEQ